MQVTLRLLRRHARLGLSRTTLATALRPLVLRVRVLSVRDAVPVAVQRTLATLRLLVLSLVARVLLLAGRLLVLSLVPLRLLLRPLVLLVVVLLLLLVLLLVLAVLVLLLAPPHLLAHELQVELRIEVVRIRFERRHVEGDRVFELALPVSAVAQVVERLGTQLVVADGRGPVELAVRRFEVAQLVVGGADVQTQLRVVRPLRLVVREPSQGLVVGACVPGRIRRRVLGGSGRLLVLSLRRDGGRKKEQAKPQQPGRAQAQAPTPTHWLTRPRHGPCLPARGRGLPDARRSAVRASAPPAR